MRWITLAVMTVEWDVSADGCSSVHSGMKKPDRYFSDRAFSCFKAGERPGEWQ
jgi:hypothetical protein